MARVDQAHPAGVPGEWYVDTRCIACGASRHWAPGLVAADADGGSYVARQPATPAEHAAMWRAAEACPTQSVGHRSVRRPPAPAFPHDVTPGVFALGNNSADSFGAHSWLVRAPAGNLLVDSPRFRRSLAERVDGLGGVRHVLLTHRDDVADADRWADRYGARVWIHADDARAAPWASDIIAGSEPVEVAPGVTVVPVPGHTRGSVAIHVGHRWLFTGDTLHWNVARRQLDVFARQTWYSWDRLADSMERLAGLRVDWVLPGHGMWHEVGATSYAEQMVALGPAMRAIGQHRWPRRATDRHLDRPAAGR